MEIRRKGVSPRGALVTVITMSGATEKPEIVIRDIDTISTMREVETLQKEVWGSDDLEVVPLTLLVAAREVGATLIGAYDGASLVGFVYGFTGYENGHITHHSHMLAVKPSYRSNKLGFKLKLAQRERVLAQGINCITWTFDPLQSLNAHLNFEKLGVVSDTYRTDFYGETTSSFLHQTGTDRLWVSWLLDSERVRERVGTRAARKTALIESNYAPALVQVSSAGKPHGNAEPELFGNEHLSIEIPWDINGLQRQDPKLAVEWRNTTRWAFQKALGANYLVQDFCSASRNDQPVGVYLLTLQKES